MNYQYDDHGSSLKNMTQKELQSKLPSWFTEIDYDTNNTSTSEESLDHARKHELLETDERKRCSAYFQCCQILDRKFDLAVEKTYRETLKGLFSCCVASAVDAFADDDNDDVKSEGNFAGDGDIAKVSKKRRRVDDKGEQEVAEEYDGDDDGISLSKRSKTLFSTKNSNPRSLAQSFHPCLLPVAILHSPLSTLDRSYLVQHMVGGNDNSSSRWNDKSSTAPQARRRRQRQQSIFGTRTKVCVLRCNESSSKSTSTLPPGSTTTLADLMKGLVLQCLAPLQQHGCIVSSPSNNNHRSLAHGSRRTQTGKSCEIPAHNADLYKMWMKRQLKLVSVRESMEMLLYWAENTVLFDCIVVILEDVETLAPITVDGLISTLKHLRTHRGLPISLIVTCPPSIGTGLPSTLRRTTMDGVVVHKFVLPSLMVVHDCFMEQVFTVANNEKDCDHEVYDSQLAILMSENGLLDKIWHLFRDYHCSAVTGLTHFKMALAQFFCKPESFHAFSLLKQDVRRSDTLDLFIVFKTALVTLISSLEDGAVHKLLQELLRLSTCHYQSRGHHDGKSKSILQDIYDSIFISTPVQILSMLKECRMKLKTHHESQKRPNDKIRDGLHDKSCCNLPKEAKKEKEEECINSSLADITESILYFGELADHDKLADEASDESSPNQKWRKHVYSDLVNNKMKRWTTTTPPPASICNNENVTKHENDRCDETTPPPQFLNCFSIQSQPRRKVAQALAQPYYFSNCDRVDKGMPDTSIAFKLMTEREISSSDWYEKFVRELQKGKMKENDKRKLWMRFEFAVFQLELCGLVTNKRRGSGSSNSARNNNEEVFERVALVWAGGS